MLSGNMLELIATRIQYFTDFKILYKFLRNSRRQNFVKIQRPKTQPDTSLIENKNALKVLKSHLLGDTTVDKK